MKGRFNSKGIKKNGKKVNGKFVGDITNKDSGIEVKHYASIEDMPNITIYRMPEHKPEIPNFSSEKSYAISCK